jgi:glycosyltransferase involved in cell wall biosynthesis
MHIVYLHPHFTYPGGSSTFVLETARRLAERGLRITLVAQRGDKDVIGDYSELDFIFVGGNLPDSFSYWANFFQIYRRVQEVLDDIAPDIIFPQVFPANYWGFLYKRYNPRVRCLWFCHEPSAFVHDRQVIDGLYLPMRIAAKISNPVMKIVDRYLVSCADQILVNSRFTASRCKEVYGIAAQKVIYPGVDLCEFPDTLPEKDDYILCVSRLTKFKRIDVALEAMKILKDAHKEKRLVIVGDGEERQNLMQMSRSMGLEDTVIFKGRLGRKELISCYAGAQCVVFPSIGEPFGIVPIEAQAAWTPVIAINDGGPMESILHGISGYLVEPHSAQLIADKIRLISEDALMRESLMVNARANVVKRFTWDNTADGIHTCISHWKNSMRSHR